MPNPDPSDTKSYHSKPRISASSAERVLACPASHARAWEMNYFCRSNNIAGSVSGSDANRGSEIHLLLSNIPFSSATLDMGGPDLSVSTYRKVMQSAEAMGLTFKSQAEKWFCVNAIRKRDQLIEGAILEVGAVESIEISLDARRLKSAMPVTDGLTEDLSGLADVYVKIHRASGGAVVVLCDFKSLYGEHAPSGRNVQLAILATLSRIEDPTIDTAYVSLIAAGQRNEEVDIAVYDGAALDRARGKLEIGVRSAAMLATQTRSALSDNETGKVPDKLDDLLTSNSITGSHCLFCKGLTCCKKVRIELAEFSKELATAGETLLPYQKIIEQSNPMTNDELVETLRSTRGFTDKFKLWEKLDGELTDLTRQAVVAGKILPGIALKDGKKVFAVRETFTPVVAEDCPYDPETLDLDISPKAIFDKLAPVIQKATGEVPEFDSFLGACCEVSPARTREYLADISGVKPGKLYEELLVPLGDENNPFIVNRQRPSIVLQKVEQVTVVEEIQPASSVRVAR